MAVIGEDSSMLLNNYLDREALEKRAVRDGYGEGLVIAGEESKNVVVLTADLKESTRSHWFADKFPERFVEVGVAEQNLMGIAAGLALSGKVPFTSSFAVFSPSRNWGQIRVSVCYNEANVKIAGGHAGLSVGPDGATHQALEDIAITRVLPNLTVLVPADAVQAKQATIAAASYQGPVYLRLSRPKSPVFLKDRPFEIGKAQLLREGKDLTVVACGPVLYEALLAAEELAPERDLEVLNVSTINPLDKKVLRRSAKKTGCVVTVEDHQIVGGLGGAVAEFLSEEEPVKITRIGVDERFGESGSPEELWEKHGLDSGSLALRFRDLTS